MHPVHDKDAEGAITVNSLASIRLMIVIPTIVEAMPTGCHRHHKDHQHLDKGSFINRIHHSIMNLGLIPKASIMPVVDRDGNLPLWL